MTDFVAFKKIPRLRRACTITEKIDGTNAQIYITPRMFSEPNAGSAIALASHEGVEYVIRAGSRSRWLTLGDDHFGFAAWVRANASELVKLGHGRHFGEWWGAGIQRQYGLTEKRFSLFNADRWEDDATRPACCSRVPILWRGVFNSNVVDDMIRGLRECGSAAAPGFMQPEGVIVFMHASRTLHKVTLEKDEEPKGETR